MHHQRITAPGYGALRAGAAIVDRSAGGRLRLTGTDRRGYLQGLLTNDIAALTPRTGCYAALLTAQGRMISDMRVLELGDAVLLDLPPESTDRVHEHLNRFIFSEDVQVEDVTRTRDDVGVYGPGACAVLEHALKCGVSLKTLALFQSVECTFGDVTAVAVGGDEPGIRGFDVIVAPADADALRAALRDAGAIHAEPESVEAVRIESGRPLFGVDMDTDTIPLEAGIEGRAISLTKGCYVGQEVIVRVLHRGQGRVARRLAGLAVATDAPVPVHGDRIMVGDREVGHVTSATTSPSLGHPVAMGYVRREFVEPRTTVEIERDGKRIVAVVTALPFVPREPEHT